MPSPGESFHSFRERVRVELETPDVADAMSKQPQLRHAKRIACYWLRGKRFRQPNHVRIPGWIQHVFGREADALRTNRNDRFVLLS